MHRLTKILAWVIVSSIFISLTGCSKQADSFLYVVSTDSDNNDVELFDGVDFDFYVPEKDEFISLLDNKLDAYCIQDMKEFKSQIVFDEKIQEGEYYESPEWVNLASVRIMGGSIGDHDNTTSVVNSLVGKKLGKNNDNEGKDYHLENCVYYIKYIDETTDLGAQPKKLEPPCLWTETYYYGSFAILLTFSSEKDAGEYFVDSVEQRINDRLEWYKRDYNYAKEGNDEKKDLTYRRLYDPNLSIRDRVFYDADALPENVYSLSDDDKGYFVFSTVVKAPSFYDVYTGTPPEAIEYKQNEADVSFIWDGKQVLFLANTRQYRQTGCEDVYYDEWPEPSFEEDDGIQVLRDDMGLRDPRSIKINDDLKEQLAYFSNINSHIIFPELFYRKEQE